MNHRLNHTARRKRDHSLTDAVVLVLVSAAAAIFGTLFDIFQKIQDLLEPLVEFNIGDFALVVFVLIAGLIWYSWRRYWKSAQSFTREEQAEEKLQESEERFREVAETAGEWIWEVDHNGLYTYSSPVVESILGHKSEEIVGKKYFYDFFAPDLREELKQQVFKVFANKASFKKFVNPNVHKDGRIVILQTSARPLIDNKGSLIGYRGTDMDITARKNTEDVLRKAKQKLESQTQSLKKTNEQIGNLYKELEKKNKQLKKLDRLKSEFVSNVSHELRTPLTSTIQTLELLLGKDLGRITQEQEKFLRIMDQDMNRLTELIDDLLDISRVEAGKMKIAKTPLDIKNLADRVLSTLELVAKGRKITLTNSISPQLSKAWGDPERIAQVLTNLVGNAIKFTPQGGSIAISAESKSGSRQGDYLEISVTDTGCGIAEENLEKLFDKFQQFARKPGPGLKGTGLGLAISKEIIKLHKGKIWAASTLGKGSRFSFTLLCFDKNKMAKRILIIDDSTTILQLISNLLEKENHICLTASNAFEGIKIANQKKPDLIILDMVLPEMSGYEVIGRLKGNAQTCDVPIVILSEYEVDKEKAEGIASRTIPILAKSSDIQELPMYINKTLQG